MFNTASLAATRGERGTMPFGFTGAVGLWKIVFELEDGSEHEIIVKGRKSRMFAVDEKGVLLYDDLNHYRWMPVE